MNIVNRAEERLARYRTDDPNEKTAMCLLAAKDLWRWQPNGPHQIYWINESLTNPFTMTYSVPRGGKTMSIETADLYDVLMNPADELVVYAPTLGQCRETLKYHYDWIDKSPVLKAYLRKRNGKPMLSSDGYEFMNGSTAKLFSIRGEIEGHNVSIARIEEFDDWPWERFANDVPRRWAAASKNKAGMRVRITGVIMGEENIFRLLQDAALAGKYKNLSVHPDWGLIDVWLLLAFGGVLDKDAVEMQQASMSADEWARSMLLRFTEAKNFIWRKYLRAGQKLSLLWGLDWDEAKKGERYERHPGETVGFGLDCGHAGQSADSSVYSLQVLSQTVANGQRYERWLGGYNWDPTTDSERLENEIVDILDYYRPDGGHGDALKYDLISSINRKCFKKGITGINIDDFPENTPGNWDKWWFQPMWNNDKGKHEMYSLLQHGIHSVKLFFPYAEKRDDRPMAVMLRKVLKQLEGIRAYKTSGLYPRYAAENKKIGDDDADALGMAERWLAVNGGVIIDPRLMRLVGRRDYF